MQSSNSDTIVLWSLPDSKKHKTAMACFADATAKYHKNSSYDYDALHAWSIHAPEEFHDALWDFLQIIGDKGDRSFQPAEDILQAGFYPQARLNYAENLLVNPDDRLAIVSHREDGTRRTVTRRQLYDLVSRFSQALEKEGVVEGDRVAAIITNEIEAIAAYLAVSAIGAIWSSCSPDFGPAGASDRLCQVKPRVLLAVASYAYSGKTIDVVPTIKAVASGCELQRIVLVGRTTEGLSAEFPCVLLDDWLSDFEAGPVHFNRLPFDAPLVIMFSSGTTGKPKCIIHSAMGLLLQHKKELMLHCDLGKDERFFYFSTCGWMMWNWQVSGLALESTLVIYDGNPFYPDPDRLLDLVDEEEISVFGTSAKYIDACRHAGLSPRQSHQLQKLRLILSTGSPLIPAGYDYIYEKWKAGVQLASISGGTDICACFLGGNPLLPVRRGELQCALLGMDLDTLDDMGNGVTGVPAELVCRNAHLSMPLGFWDDNDGSRYHDAYFSRFPGLWNHGDFVEKRPTGGFVIHGRSDTTLNPGGVRIGTAEIYRQVETIAEVEECIAVGQDINGDQRVILFIILRKGSRLDEELIKRIKQQIRTGATPRHVPAMIIAVDAIPRTRSGKISEIAVRDTIHGRPIKNTTALANPECLEIFKNIPELQD